MHHYDKKYIRGRWFYGRAHGIVSQGWKWLVLDYRMCKKFKVNQDAGFPVSPMIRVVAPRNITFHPDDLNNFQGTGNYYQALGGIEIGRGTYIAPNVGLISQNHDVNDPSERAPGKKICIGKNCWIGMNSVILPGVTLGDHVVVGAGSVVTRSFPQGYCVIAGNPAKKLRDITKESFGKTECEILK